MKFELSLHSYSPKVEMFQQVANDRGVQHMDCQAVIEYNGQLSCEVPQIQDKSEDITMNEHDHKYLHWDEGQAPIVILYGQIGSKST